MYVLAFSKFPLLTLIRMNLHPNLRTTGAIKDEQETDRMRFRWINLIHYLLQPLCIVLCGTL